MIITQPIMAHERLLSGAERAGRQLIHSWILHRPKQLNHFEPDHFPTGVLQQVACGVLHGMNSEGVRDLAGLMAYFSDAPEAIKAEMLECTQDFAPLPSDCAFLQSKLAAYHQAFELELESRKLTEALASGSPTSETIQRLAEIDAGTHNAGAATQLESRAFDFDVIPPRPIPIMTLQGKPLCTAGNLTNIQAPAKAGKSAALESQMAAVISGNRQDIDTLGFAAENPQGFALIHIDTEQSRFDHDALVRRAVRRAKVDRTPAWFHSYSLADLNIRERRQALHYAMREGREAHGGVFAVMIDGIGDLCADPNDSAEAFALVAELHTAAITYGCAIITVLHENPGGSEIGKTRGHLGSQVERKAETNLRLAKDVAGVTTMWAEKARHCYLPKSEGPCFAWNDQAMMHTSCGSAREIKSAELREKMLTGAEQVFSEEDWLSYTDLVAGIMDKLKLKERAAKNRVTSWSAEGVIEKDLHKNYILTNP
jgi:hypothetical protein